MQSPQEIDKVKHLLRRFGLGASEAEVDFYGSGGYEAAVDRLLESINHQESVELGVEYLQNKDGQVVANPRQAQAVWYAEQLVTNRPLNYKMALFWHDHFATSAQKVSNGPTMLNQMHLFRDKGLGYFRDLLIEVSQDPAMLYWLDNQNNVVGKPNENFAREVMELFTLGEGNYTEKDIQEAARAFTGMTYGFQRGQRVVLNRNQVPPPQSIYILDQKSHDTGFKTVLGNKGEWNGDDVVGILAAAPRTAAYLTEKLWKWFVSPTPEKSTVDKFAATFRKANLHIPTLLKAIMLSDEFLAEGARRSIIKNPFDFCIPMARQLGIGAGIANAVKSAGDDEVKRRAVLGVPVLIKQSTSVMGMELMYPPDVSGWPSGTDWISTSTMVERISWGQELFIRNSRATQLRADQIFGTGDPSAVTDRVLSVFDCRLPTDKKAGLVAAARKESGGTVTARNANLVYGAIAKLMCSTPEFQFM